MIKTLTFFGLVGFVFAIGSFIFSFNTVLGWVYCVVIMGAIAT